LDETYVRVLSQIPQANQAHAHRMLQCLVVVVRPLRVEELAELLAFEFDAAQGGIPKYRAAWRLDDQTQAVLSTCSSLVTIINKPWSGRQVVQFSHFSVKEFLISDRFTSSLGDFSHYHIRPGSAHTILAQACLGFLLHLDDHIDEESLVGFPLAKYAAEYWIDHAQFEDVASHVKDGMETLFDSDKPYFAAWIWIYDIDYEWVDWGSEISPTPNPNPLYYAVLCGFYGLVKYLAIKHPQHVNAIYGRYRFPLLAALSQDDVEVAELLLEHGANVDVRETTGETILLKVLSRPRRNFVNIVKFLLKHGVDVNARDNHLRSSLHLAEYRGELELAQMLVEHKADVNSQNNNGMTPLHILSGSDNDESDVLNHALLLLKHGAEVDRRDNDNDTPLLLAMWRDQFKLARTLLEHGADVNAENNNGKTPLHILSESDIKDEGDVLNHALLLLKHGAEVDRRDNDNETPLHLVMRRDRFKIAWILLEHGADANAENNNRKTPLRILLESRIYDEGYFVNHARLLLEHGVWVSRRDEDNKTQLLLGIGREKYEFTRIIIEPSADATTENKMVDLETSVQQVSRGQYSSWRRGIGIARQPLERGVDLNPQDEHQMTPSHLQSNLGPIQIAILLLAHGANLNARKNGDEILLYQEIEGEYYIHGDCVGITRLLTRTLCTRRECTTKQAPPDSVALGIFVWLGRNGTGAARPWCKCRLGGQPGPDPVAPSCWKQ